jgi:hypothetical protein
VNQEPTAVLRATRARGGRLVAEQAERLWEAEQAPVERDPTEGLRYCSICQSYYSPVGESAAWHRQGGCVLPDEDPWRGDAEAEADEFCFGEGDDL